MMGVGMIFFMLLFWAALILGAVWLARSLFQPSHSASGSMVGTSLSARQILEQRYARGEITREQYLLMSKDL
jgi:putative membrane protein